MMIALMLMQDQVADGNTWDMRFMTDSYSRLVELYSLVLLVLCPLSN